MTSTLKIGIIGFDTSHAPAFANLLNNAEDPNHIPGARIVAGYPSFSPDVESSASRVEGYTAELRDKFGLVVTSSIDELLEQVDAVLLESVDGRRHLAEATPVILAGKRLFIDKPLASNYTEAVQIARLAAEHGVPFFSSSSLRYDANMQAIKNDPDLGEIIACDAFSPASLHPSNPGLFWYGIHGVETLYTFMGAGCQSVRCYRDDSSEVTTGRWADGRIGTMRGLRKSTHDYGATVFGTKKISHSGYSRDVPMYAQLLKEVVPFLLGGPAPIPVEETLEIMAFMQAALVSADEGREVSLAEIQTAG